MKRVDWVFVKVLANNKENTYGSLEKKCYFVSYLKIERYIGKANSSAVILFAFRQIIIFCTVHFLFLKLNSKC